MSEGRRLVGNNHLKGTCIECGDTVWPGAGWIRTNKSTGKKCVIHLECSRKQTAAKREQAKLKGQQKLF